MENIMSIVVLTLLLLITLIVVILIWLNKYNKNSEEMINRRLNQLSDKTDDNLTTIEDYINDFMIKAQNILKKETKELSKNIKSNIDDNKNTFIAFIKESENSLKKQNKQFSYIINDIETRYNKFETDHSYELKSFIKNLELDYRKYVKEVSNTNDSLIITIEKFNENSKQMKILTPEIEKNYKSLEKISDKTKELIATHENNLLEQINLFEENMTDVRTKYHDSMYDITSTTETILNKSIEDSSQSIHQLFEKIKIEYDNLSNNSINELEALSKHLKLTINKEIEKTDLKKAVKTIEDFTQQLKLTVETNTLNIADIKKYVDEKVLEIDAKIETLIKKRRLF